jgi:hypothetical protein
VARTAVLVKCAGLAIWAGAVLAVAALEPPVLAGGDEKVAAPSATREKLVGVWKLNPELSEDPRAKMTEGSQGGGRGPGGSGGAGGRGGGPGGGAPAGGGFGGPSGGGPPGGPGGGRGSGGVPGGGPPGEGGFARPMAFGPQVTVTNLAPEITMIDPDGEIRRLHADNKAYRDSSGSEVKTRWEEASLVVETKTGRGTVKETWAVTGPPLRLTVLVRMNRPFGGGDVTVKRVFDHATLDAARPSEAP